MMGWMGHIIRMGELRNDFKIVDGNLNGRGHFYDLDGRKILKGIYWLLKKPLLHIVSNCSGMMQQNSKCAFCYTRLKLNMCDFHDIGRSICGLLCCNIF